MKSVIRKGILVLVAVAALPLAVLVVLAAQGRLRSQDVEAFRQVPVLGSLLPAAEEEEEAAGSEPAVDCGRPASAPPRPGAEDSWRDEVDLRDPDVLMRELAARRRFYDDKIDELERERERNARRRAELDDREQVLLKLQQKIEVDVLDLKRAREELDRRVTLLDAQEEANFKDTGKAIAEMDSEKAAEALSALDETKAARILRVMDASAAGSILSEIRDPEKRKGLIDLYARLGLESKVGGN